MFLSKRDHWGRPAGGALTGPVTLPGDQLGVWLEGERRGVTVYAPGGYHWAPALGDEVLVLKTGEEGEKPCAVGVPAGAGELMPGEVLITAGEASLKLGLNGRVDITGELYINGAPLFPPAEEDEEENKEEVDA